MDMTFNSIFTSANGSNRTPNSKRSMRALITGLALSSVLLSSCAPASGPSAIASSEEQTHEGDETPPPPTSEDQKAIDNLKQPSLTQQEQINALAQYPHLDPGHMVPDKLLSQAVIYYNANKANISNPNYLTIVDFSKNSEQARFFIVDMQSGKVAAIHVAHGKNSDPNDDGFATVFSNKVNSEMSSLGYYRASETYIGKHGLSVRLDGLSSTNSNVRSRAIVLHGADYVYDTNRKAGRSWGCLAVSMAKRDSLVKMLKGGSIIYVGVAK
jgi:hypothetical protein